MSGICGVIANRRRFGRAESPGVELELLELMTDALRHRGPDDAGFLLVGGPEGARRLETVESVSEMGREGEGARGRNGQTRTFAPSPSRPIAPSGIEVGLGVRRLAVSDPAGGHQPIGNEEGTVWVVLDGVIANAGELRQELVARGHHFATRAEAEVIVHAYEEHGLEGVRRLRGQFALALWDDRRRLLLLARDPSGLRPLFIAETGERFLFASEIRALRRDRSLSPRLDPEAARHFLAHGELPVEQTLFQEIRELAPGQMLLRQASGALSQGTTRREPLRPDGIAPPTAPPDPAEAWDVVRQSVAAYMASDLPGGAAGRGIFLDGSLASAALVLVAREEVAALPTFSLAGRGSGAARARRVAHALRAQHQEIRPEGNAEGLWLELLRRLDLPPAHPGMHTPFLLCRGAQEAVRVALVTGSGAWPGGAFGIDGRAPFRDEVLLRDAGGEQGVTALLQRAMGGRVPRWLLRCPDAAPADMEAWHDLGGLAPVVERVLASDAVRARGLAEPGSVAQWRAGWQRGDLQAAKRLWALLALELWLRIHVDRDLREADDRLTGGKLSPADLGMTRGRTRVAVESAFAPSPLLFGTPAVEGGEGRPLSILLATQADPAEPFTAPARLAREWSVRLASRGHRVTVLTAKEATSPAADVELLDGVEIVRFPVSGKGPRERHRSATREAERALRGLGRTRAVDVMVMDHPATALRRAEIGRDTPRLYLFHGAGAGTESDGGARARGWVREERASLLTCDGCLAPSRFAAAQLAARHGDLGLTATLIPGGVDAARFQPVEERWELRRRLGLPESAFLLLTVRPLAPGMGLENLITAMAGIHAAYPEAHLVIGGAGPLESELRRQVVHQQLGRVVTLAGRIPEESLTEYYAAADLFVMPSSRSDALGMAAVEALACGTPVFATPVGALPERLTHLDARCLLAGTGAGAIADGVIRHLPDLHHDETLRRRCRQLALEHYDWEVLIPQLECYLNDCVARRRQPAAAPPPGPRGLVPHWPCFE